MTDRQWAGLNQLLEACVSGTALTGTELRQLEELTLSDRHACHAFFDSKNASQAIQARLDLLQDLFPQLDESCGATLGWSTMPLHTCWRLWLPLAMQLAEAYRQLGRPLVQGILGGQGTGKTTLTTLLSLILNHLGYCVCGISIDDIYKTYADRLKLQAEDARLKWRGPPGTHDIDLGIEVLRQLRTATPDEAIKVPRFDKSAHQGAGDRTDPDIVSGIDIVLFEGWFVGERPLDPATFDQAPSPIDTDADRAFARDMNERLHDYLPLWQELDRLLVLYPTDYRLSQTWRQDAERQMKASGKSGMSDEDIQQFVTYFWRALHPELFIPPLLEDAHHVDLVVEVHPDHTPGKVYCPSTVR
ncbi:MAG: glycerate kinase [Elainellaceae cyanobacterium]